MSEIKSTRPEGLKATIAALEKVLATEGSKGFDIYAIHEPIDDMEAPRPKRKDIEDAIECGTVCCLAGWTGLTPEWREFGGTIHPMSGWPMLLESGIDDNEVSLAEFWGLPVELTQALCAVGGHDTLEFYSVMDSDEITIPLVIEKLKTYLP